MSGILDNDEEVNAQIEAVLSEDQEEFERLASERAILKMLVTDNIAGAIIGKNGKTIAEMQEECGARIKVSQSSDFYPGTSERTILITGPENNVLQAQELIWQKIAQFYKPYNEGIEQTSNSISGKILIPTECGGLIIGRGGMTIRSIQEESGARVQVTSKDNPESKISRERILTLSGSLGACIKGSQLVLLKMLEDPSVTYQNKSTSYGRLLAGRSLGSRVNGLPINDLSLPLGAETLSATSTITIAVPEPLIGQILGKKGATIREIQQLSGAKVIVSARGENEDGSPDLSSDRTRTVTITGSPSNAQMAQLLVTQKLQLAKNGIRR
mmetsp:Transcript_1388/g.1393  ORF Transcript_1388/g.1393 Transcript_1388/m.1393 type:complete len:328 (+) Transcript_1388:167-1150(+)|eukprot:CAMPEP_0174817988 /NCGR_PEP_ID=MMETSP1107-20130205/575_1 /TAXON_ID=36770 /ORGANISM="Paraphysomonas vestita, Strain GFlagA" /LENGTH=327 /DNA_ID=CAMNT_0016029239 /DNA_START=86 /DNA_END=1069 /DNA_ORIENTATION=+